MPIATEVTVPAGAFVAAVQWAAKWIVGKPVSPIQGCISLTLPAHGQLVVGAFGDTASVRAVVDTEYPEHEEVVHQRAFVSGRLLAELVGALGKQPVVLSGSDDGASVVLTQGKFVATLPTMAEDDQPTLPSALPAIGSVSGEVFAAAVARVAPMIGRDASPAFLNAGYLEFMASGEIVIMGTDKFRVAKVTVPWKAADQHNRAITPLGSTLADAAEAFAGPDDVEVGMDGGLLSLTSPTRSLTMTTMDLIDDEGVLGWPVGLLSANLDAEPSQSVVLSRGELVQPLKRARIMRGKEGPVRITIADGELAIGAKEGTSSRGSADAIEVTYSGPEYAAGFNPDYLADALRTCPTEQVRFAFTEPRRPALLTSDTDPTWRHLMMPIRIL